MRYNDWIFEIENDRIQMLTSTNDRYGMNWAEGSMEWGQVECRQHLECHVERRFTDRNTLEEKYIFHNNSAFDVYCPAGDISVAVTLNDSYHEAELCLTKRCHAHIFIGGRQSWIMALRMGGDAPHLGLYLTQGALNSYSIQRNIAIENVSNDRGDFLLHPEEFHLKSGESYTLAWELFWHDGKEDFDRIVAAYPNHIEVDTAHYVWFQGEEAKIRTNADQALEMVDTQEIGEKNYQLLKNGNSMNVSFLVIPKFDKLLKRRAQFIARRQQCTDPDSALYGAYLIYDNQTGKQVYNHFNPDHNAARERIAMGVAVALAVQNGRDSELEQSLDRYADFIMREIFDEANCVVADDVHYDIERHRLYNYAWLVCFFVEMYRVKSDILWLERAVKAVRGYYAAGGHALYCNCMPMTELCHLLKQTGMTEEAEIRALFVNHARLLAQRGLQFPKFEVDYEQGIVESSVSILQMGYELCGDMTLFNAMQEHIEILKLFNGQQPDYHMNEVAIRHWDGYWFGKNRLLGDCYPHYWSSLSGDSFMRMFRLTGDDTYRKRAENSLRASLSLFFPDGSASCAMVWPHTVNGLKAHCYDPWANDQDWALYFYYKNLEMTSAFA